IGSHLDAASVDRRGVTVDPGDTRFGQQRLDDHLRLLIRAFAELTVPDAALRIDEIQRGPILVAETAPYDVLAVDRDRIVDAHVLHGPADVARVLFERELRRVDADHHQALIAIFLVPGADVGHGAAPVDAGVSPEIDEHDLPAQGLRGQGRRIEPFVRAL